MPAIVLATLNARFSHAHLGLRCLRANLGALREHSVIREFTIQDNPAQVAESILEDNPQIVGLSISIWNLRQSEAVAGILKAVRPELRLVIGGPEVSFGTEHSRFAQLADVVVQGEGDQVFHEICTDMLAGKTPARVVPGGSPNLSTLALPYAEYTNEDLAKRIIYVEASRGCPFTCAFCLSALDDGVRQVPLERFLPALEDLLQRGCRTFKFVDRTFNLKPSTCSQLLDFFYQRWPREADGSLVAPLTARQMDQGSTRNNALFLHFEMVPDRLPEALREKLLRFPAGAIQLEVGIQSFTPEVGAVIKRRMDTVKTHENLSWLRDTGHLHVHADLIIGLPAETPESFLASFDQLWHLRPGEIQVGILKLLRGAPLNQLVQAYSMAFNPEPPYDLLCSRDWPFSTMQRFKHFARYYEIFVNSDRFPHSVELLIQQSPTDSPGAALLAFSDRLWSATGQDHALALPRQFDLLADALDALGAPAADTDQALLADFLRSGSPLRHAPARIRAAAEAARPHPGSKRLQAQT